MLSMLQNQIILAANLLTDTGWIGTLIIGLIIGVIAKFLMPGRDPGGCIVTIIIGLVGSFIGGLLGKLLFVNSNYAAGWIMSVIGAMILLFLYRLIAKPKV